MIVVWDHTGSLSPTAWRLTGPSGTLTPAWAQPSLGPSQYWTHAYAHALTLPAGIKPGLYTLAQPNHPPAALTVTLPSKQTEWLRYTQLSKDDAVVQIEAILKHGDLSLSPGLYELSRPVTIPPGRRLRGHGAVLQARGAECVFRCGDGASLEGLAVHGDGQWLADVNPVPTNLSLGDCAFRGVNLGAGRGLVTIDCAWDRCGAILGTEHYHLRPVFRGTFAGNSTLIRGSGAAIVDGAWRDTDRGPCFQTNWGDVSDCLLLHPDISGLHHVFNGCEGVLAEGPAEGLGRFDRNVVLHLRYAGDGPAYQIMGPPAADNVLREFTVDGGGGVVLDSGQNMIERTTLAGGELRGTAGAQLGRNVSGTRWWFPTTDPAWPLGRQEPTRILHPAPNRGAQYGAPPPAGWRPVRDEGADNDTGDLEVVALPIVKPVALRFGGP